MRELERTNEEIRCRSLRINEENARLRDDLKASAAELASAQARVNEYMSKLTEAEEKTMPLQFEVMKLQREKELLSEQCKWCEDELTAKNADILRIRSEYLDKASVLENQLADFEQNCKAVEDRVRYMEVTNDSCLELLFIFLK